MRPWAVAVLYVEICAVVAALVLATGLSFTSRSGPAETPGAPAIAAKAERRLLFLQRVGASEMLRKGGGEVMPVYDDDGPSWGDTNWRPPGWNPISPKPLEKTLAKTPPECPSTINRHKGLRICYLLGRTGCMTTEVEQECRAEIDERRFNEGAAALRGAAQRYAEAVMAGSTAFAAISRAELDLCDSELPQLRTTFETYERHAAMASGQFALLMPYAVKHGRVRDLLISVQNAQVAVKVALDPECQDPTLCAAIEVTVTPTTALPKGVLLEDCVQESPPGAPAKWRVLTKCVRTQATLEHLVPVSVEERWTQPISLQGTTKQTDGVLRSGVAGIPTGHTLCSFSYRTHTLDTHCGLHMVPSNDRVSYSAVVKAYYGLGGAHNGEVKFSLFLKSISKDASACQMRENRCESPLHEKRVEGDEHCPFGGGAASVKRECTIRQCRAGKLYCKHGFEVTEGCHWTSEYECGQCVGF